MDFIERLFGISPDGGNGVLEAIYLFVIAIAVLLVVRRPLARLLRRRS